MAAPISQRPGRTAIKSVSSPEVGSRAPDFVLSGPNRNIRLSDFRGQTVILAFAAPGWDPALGTQMALFNTLARQIEPAGAQLLGIGLESPWCNLDLVGEATVRFPLLHDFDPAGGIAQRYGVSGNRALFVVDAAGIVRAKWILQTGLLPTPRMLDEVWRSLSRPLSVGGPALTRRQFLLGSLAISAALALSPLPAAAAEGTSRRLSDASEIRTLVLNVNGVDHQLEVDSRVTLLDALREYIGLTGTKKGCDQGTCGACTVLADGRRIKSCLTLALMREGQRITTIEGLAASGRLHPLQAAFISHDALQCGYCTPGQIISALALIDEGHARSDGEIREWMSGNLCRCGCYPNIVDAIHEVAAGSKP